jgi:hypothetical protein
VRGGVPPVSSRTPAPAPPAPAAPASGSSGSSR